MANVTTIPLLLGALALFWMWLGWRTANSGRITRSQWLALYAWIFALGTWGVITAWLARTGYYASDAFLAWLPGLWWPMIPMGLTLVFAGARSFRAALSGVFEFNSRQIVAMHALRIAAVGSIFKAINGHLPISFALPIGLPDAAFGLSALVLAWSWNGRSHSTRTLLLWNLAGVALILPAPILMQLGLPGPLHIFQTAPDARALFEFPMVMAPTLIVPLFFTVNVIHAAVLWQGARTDAGTGLPASSLAAHGKFQ